MKAIIRFAAIAAAVVMQSLSLFASDIAGITNIHANAFVPYRESSTGKSVGNVSMWLAMSEDGLAKKLYLDQHYAGAEVLAARTPDALFPSNTVAASVWRDQGVALTNVYNVLKEIIDPQIVSVLTNFGPLVKSVTRGAGSATIPYVDADGKQQFGKAIVLGCNTNDWTAYNILVKEFKKLGKGYEDTHDPSYRRYIVTDSSAKILGSRTPSVAYGSLGYVIITTSEAVWSAVEKAAVDFAYGRKPFYDARRARAAVCDAYLDKADPTHVRAFKTEGFERFAYAWLSPRYQQAAATLLEDYGFNLELPVTNKTYHYFATLCSEECSVTNSRMRIDLQGSEAALRTIGATLRFNNLFLVNAGILDADFMTFDEDWKYDPETLAKVSHLTQIAREHLGLKGATCYFNTLKDRVSVNASIGYTAGRGFEQLVCAGKTGGLEENPCEACLPTNTVAAFSFQPNVATWVELNERLFTLLGKKSEILDQLFAAFKSHPNSFGKSAAVGFVLGSGDAALGSAGAISNALDFVSVVKIEDENLWISLRILLEQFGCRTYVSPYSKSITVCEFPNSTMRVAYDSDYKIVKFATTKKSSGAVSVALRDEKARLISPYNKVFNDRMGIAEGETLPDHNTLFYFAPERDTVLVETLKEYLDDVGLGVLSLLIRDDAFKGVWACGTGKADAEKGLFETRHFVSSKILDKGENLFKALAKTLGQIAADAYPYDASQARVFTSGAVTLHVSRADNWDDVNHRLYPYAGENIRVRAQLVAPSGKLIDQTASGTLASDGSFALSGDGLSFNGYFSSEGVFCSFKRGTTTCLVVGRLAPEIEAELSVLPSAEEIAEEVKKVVEAIGIESVTVGAAQSEEHRTGPFGEVTAVRETTIVPTPGGGLDKLMASVKYTGKISTAKYMPSNTLYGTTFTFADGALTNALAVLKLVQPELMEYFEKLFGGFGITEAQLAATVKDGLALGIAKEDDGLEPYFVVRLNRGQKQHWVDLTNRLYHTAGVTVKDFKASQSNKWEAIAFTREDPLTGRTIERCYTRIFESADIDPVFIITQDTEIMSGITARVRRAGLYGSDRLQDDDTYKACMIPVDSASRGFTYLAPMAEKYWFYDRFYVIDGELVIKRRTSAGVAPYEAVTMRFIVNFFEALRGEQSKISFENDPAADKVAEAAAKRITEALHRMRTALGVTGLNFYDGDPDEDGRYGNAELAIGTKGDGCEFLKRFAADAPASEHLVEQYIPDVAAALATRNGEAGIVPEDLSDSLKAFAALVGEKYPEVAVAITNFLASDEWKLATESARLSGTHKAFAVLQVPEYPFVKPIGDGNFASISAGYGVIGVFGPMDSSLPYLLIKQAFVGKETWEVIKTNGVEYLTYSGIDAKYRSFVQPTFAYDEENKVMIFSSRLDAAQVAMSAGRDGTNRLIDSETFADVMGFKQGEPMPAHNTLYYFAPQNDDILGCTLRRILGPYLPDGYAMLLDRPSLKSYWGGAYGTRVKDAFRLYIHAGMKGHTAALAAAQALLKTAAESMRVRQPYDWTESKVLRSADVTRLIEPTSKTNVYALSTYTDVGAFLRTEFRRSDSDNSYAYYDMRTTWIFSKTCLFCSVKNGMAVYNAGRDAFHFLLLDETADPDDYTGGVAMAFDAREREQTLSAGEKVEQKFHIWPADAKVTKVTGLPKGLSLKKMADGYFLTGTPTKVGEDCLVTITAAFAGRETSTRDFRIMISNYASDYAELDAGYDLTAGVEGELNLTNVIGWTASGVPSGMKFDKATGALSGTPAKPGEYVVTFTKKIDGATEKVSTVITVGQEDGIQIDVAFNDKTSGLRADGVTRAVYVGVKVDWPVEVTGLEGVETKLSVKGLPAGLKLVKAKDGSYAIQGIATKASAIDKKTGEMKPSTVVLSGTNKYKWTGVEAFDLVVKALPDWAIGTFNGYNGNVQGDVCASVKVTVSSVGKLSISVSGVSPATHRVLTDSFTCNGFDSYDSLNKCFAFVIENAKWKEGEPSRFTGAIEFDPTMVAVGQEVGRYSSYSDMGEALFVQQGSNDNWGKWTFPTGKDQLTLDLTDEVNPGLEGLTLKFAKGGKATVAGKVTDPETGRLVSVSASAPLVAEPYLDDVFGDGIIRASVGFVVKTKTPFYAYVPVWLEVYGSTVIEVYETDPTKDE